VITDRLLKIIEAETDQRNRFKALEDETGIGKDSWAAAWHRKQRPTADMIEAIAKRWPDYAFWLACGDTEPERGHIAPANLEISFPVIPGVPQLWASQERLYKQRLLRKVPAEPELRLVRDQTIRDEVFKIRQEQIMPAVQLNYERIMRALNQDAKDDFFLLEYDEELRKIRLERWKAEEKLQTTLYNERKLLGQSAQAEDVIKKLRLYNPLKELLALVRFW
jgi:hypothetical protein